MHNKRRFLIALALAILAALFAVRHLQAVETRKILGNQSGRAIVTVKPVSKGTKITPDVIAYLPIAEELIPANAFIDVETILGRTTARDLPKGSLLLEEHLITGRTLAQRLAGSLYGFTLSVDERNAIAGLLRPGDYVDVISVLAGRALTGAASVTVLRQVPVMAVNGVLGGDSLTSGTGRTTVTLGLSLHEAQTLALFEEYSTLRLILCSELGDGGTGSVEPTELEQVLSQRGINLRDEFSTDTTDWNSLLQGISWPGTSTIVDGSLGTGGEVIRGTTVERRDLN
jgi:Flp pilus assembly protein CpaB